VHTVEPDRPRATAFAVAGGKFVYVGDDAGAAAFVGPNTVTLELPGKTVTPGFIDAHAHPRPIYPDDNRWAGVEAGPHKCKSIDDLVDAEPGHSAALTHLGPEPALDNWRMRLSEGTGAILLMLHLDAAAATVAPPTIKEITIDRTVVGGKTVYGR
jgi:predicted amidohydrolase YtcJ